MSMHWVRSAWRMMLGVLATSLLGCSPPPQAADGAAPADPTVTLHVLVTTDFHGQLQPHTVTLGDGTRTEVGGPALLGGYVANLRRAAPERVLLFDAGDILPGTLAADTLRGQPVVDAYNLLGYDAVALGNHDFDFGRSVLLARAAQAHYSVLAANVLDKVSGHPFTAPGLRPSLLLERDGVMVGVVGVATPETPSTTLRAHTEGLVFDTPARAIVEQARLLRERGAQVVIALAHLGSNCRNNGPAADDLASCETEAPLFRLARELPAGTVDLLVGGHTHGLVAKRIGGTPVIVPGSNGQWLGRVDLVVSRTERRVLGEQTVLQPLQRLCSSFVSGTTDCPAPRSDRGGADPTAAAPPSLEPASYAGAPVKPDLTVQALLQPVFAQIEQLQQRPLGVEAATPLTRAYQQESGLGDLICDALLWKLPEAKVALHNAGGVRADLPAGPLRFGQVYQMMPFDNRVTLMKVPGAELRRMLEIGLAGRHGLVQVGGLTLVADPRLPRPLVSATFADGTALDDQASYLVVTNDYLATGGSGMDAVVKGLPDGTIDVRETKLRDVVVEYLEQLGRSGVTLGGPDRPLPDPARPRIQLLAELPDRP